MFDFNIAGFLVRNEPQASLGVLFRDGSCCWLDRRDGYWVASDNAPAVPPGADSCLQTDAAYEPAISPRPARAGTRCDVATASTDLAAAQVRTGRR